MADLEALLGHAVVLSDNLLNDYSHHRKFWLGRLCACFDGRHAARNALDFWRRGP